MKWNIVFRLTRIQDDNPDFIYVCVYMKTNFQVDVVCYSEYLSSRDEKDFEDLFKFLEVEQKDCSSNWTSAQESFRAMSNIHVYYMCMPTHFRDDLLYFHFKNQVCHPDYKINKIVLLGRSSHTSSTAISMASLAAYSKEVKISQTSQVSSKNFCRKNQKGPKAYPSG
jgi:hypothetical protein